jgi:predicted amidophosphoribosyltransferase
MLDEIIHFLFPRTCVATGQEGEYLSKDGRKELVPHPEICPASHRFSRDFRTLPWYQKDFALEWIHIGFYYGSYLKKLILKLKYYHQKDVIDTLVDRLLLSVQTNTTLWNTLNNWSCCLTYVPSHRWRKFFYKGYNQSELLAKNIGIRLLIPCVTIAKKNRYTTSQTRLSRAKRLKNLHGSFVLTNAQMRKHYETIVIIDDIVTTWSTINTLASMIKSQFPDKHVWWLVLGRHNA